MDGYTVRRLARIAGVSVRTLHHYDRIGLLAPKSRSASGYRLYGEAEMLRLQQILFFRELDFPLTEIARILDDPEFDPVQALRGHRAALEGRLGRLHRLLKTLDDTLEKYEGGKMLKDEDMYAGFAPERIAAIKAEARERWGSERVEESERRVRSMTREGFQAVSREGDAINRGLAALMGRDPGAPEVRAAVARHHAWIRHFWTPDAEAYRGLGLHYAEHPEFRAYYDKYAPGLADFLREAIARYCEEFPD